MTEDMKIQELDIFLDGVCAAVIVNAAGAITVMLAFEWRRRVAYSSAGHERWFLSDWELHCFCLQALTIPFQGKLYATAANSADKNKSLYICQIDPPRFTDEGFQSLYLQPPRMLVKCPLVGPMGTAHLVQCGSELMLVGYSDTSGAHLMVYKVSDLIKGKVIPITNIGEHAIFFELGRRTGIRVERPRIDQYDLHSGTWSPAIDEDILHSDKTPASPYTLAHHIYTCCYRCYWNKGLMICSSISPDWSLKPNLRIGELNTPNVKKMAGYFDCLTPREQQRNIKQNEVANLLSELRQVRACSLTVY